MLKVNYVVDFYGHIYYMTEDARKAYAFKKNLLDREFAEELEVISGKIDMSTAEIIRKQIDINIMDSRCRRTSTKGL